MVGLIGRTDGAALGAPVALAKREVPEAFDRVARSYDLMVGLNPGYRQHLRLAAEALLDRVSVADPVLLDLGCGSGLSTAELLAAAQRRGLRPTIIGVDASVGMLEQARARSWPAEVDFRQARAEELSSAQLPAADGVLACYLLRNVADLSATLTGIREVMKPGAPLVIEEYSVADSAAARRRWQVVNAMIISPLAGLVAGERELYGYLHGSVNEFLGVDQLAEQLQRCGLRDVERRTVGGWQRDILHLLRATA